MFLTHQNPSIKFISH